MEEEQSIKNQEDVVERKEPDKTEKYEIGEEASQAETSEPACCTSTEPCIPNSQEETRIQENNTAVTELVTVRSEAAASEIYTDPNYHIPLENSKSLTHHLMNFGKKKVILVGLGFLTLILAFWCFNYYTRYNNAQKSLTEIDTLISNNQDSQAFADLKQFISSFNISDFPSQADKRIKMLNDKSNMAYSGILSKLGSDTSEDFTQTAQSLKDFQAQYSYSQVNSNAVKLLNLINDYKVKNDKLDQDQKIKGFSDFVFTLDKDINEVENMHTLEDSAINNKDQSATATVISLFASNSAHFEGMPNFIESAKANDVNSVIFSPSEYDEIEQFIANGLVPGEALVNIYSQDLGYDYKSVSQSWSQFASVEDTVKNLVSQKKAEVQSTLDELDSLQKETDSIKKEILSNASSSNSQNASTTKLL